VWHLTHPSRDDLPSNPKPAPGFLSRTSVKESPDAVALYEPAASGQKLRQPVRS
jgi:hypothetical protein